MILRDFFQTLLDLGHLAAGAAGLPRIKARLAQNKARRRRRGGGGPPGGSGPWRFLVGLLLVMLCALAILNAPQEWQQAVTIVSLLLNVLFWAWAIKPPKRN